MIDFLNQHYHAIAITLAILFVVISAWVISRALPTKNPNPRAENKLIRSKTTWFDGALFIVATVTAILSAYVFTASPYYDNHGEPAQGTVEYSAVLGYKDGAEPLVTGVKFENDSTVRLVFANYEDGEASQASMLTVGEETTLYCINLESNDEYAVDACTFDKNYDLVNGVKYFEENTAQIQGLTNDN